MASIHSMYAYWLEKQCNNKGQTHLSPYSKLLAIYCVPTFQNIVIYATHTIFITEQGNIRGRTIKFANLPPCACRGSTGKNGLMMLTNQCFTAVLLLICGSLFRSCIYYCLRVFWCAAARMLELELEQ